MEISEVRIFLSDEDRLKAYVTVTFDKCFVVRDLKVIQGNAGLFVAMPSKKGKDGTYKDIAHPINSEFRQKLEDIILERYHEEFRTGQGGHTADVGAGPAVNAAADEPARAEESALIQRVQTADTAPVQPSPVVAYDIYRDAEAGIGPSYKK